MGFVKHFLNFELVGIRTQFKIWIRIKIWIRVQIGIKGFMSKNRGNTWQVCQILFMKVRHFILVSVWTGSCDEWWWACHIKCKKTCYQLGRGCLCQVSTSHWNNVWKWLSTLALRIFLPLHLRHGRKLLS